jgi:hypothetical protein
MRRGRDGRLGCWVAGAGAGACASLALVLATAWSAVARAQVPPPPTTEVPTVTTPPADDATAPPPPPAPSAPAPARAVAVDAEPAEPAGPRPVASDLDVEARRWAIGYAGFSQVPVGLFPNATDITVPAIGFRYWSSPTFGVDLSVGFAWSGGSNTNGSVSLAKNSVYGFIVQGGLPFALSTHRHVSFQVIPFVAIAHGETSSGTGASMIDFSGTRVDIGARTGFELFFGFIGIPQLALSTTVGVQFEARKYSSEGVGMTGSDTTLGVSTTVQNNPWDIFTGNVAARYYF